MMELRVENGVLLMDGQRVGHVNDCSLVTVTRDRNPLHCKSGFRETIDTGYRQLMHGNRIVMTFPTDSIRPILQLLHQPSETEGDTPSEQPHD